MSDLQQQIDAEVQAHNELHAQIQTGEEQLVALRTERDRRYGRITILQELIASEASAQSLATDPPSEDLDVDPDPDNEPEEAEVIG